MKNTNERLKKTPEEIQSQEQAGFKSSYSMTGHFHIVHGLKKKSREYDVPIYIDHLYSYYRYGMLILPTVVFILPIRGTFLLVLNKYVNNSNAHKVRLPRYPSRTFYNTEHITSRTAPE